MTENEIELKTFSGEVSQTDYVPIKHSRDRIGINSLSSIIQNNNNKNNETIISSIEVNEFKNESKELLNIQNKNTFNYTPQLSQNIFKNIIPTARQIRLNKKWTNRNKLSEEYKIDEKSNNKNPFPLVKINTLWREQIRLFCNCSHVLHPSGVIKKYWNAYILILLIYTCLVIPLTIAFSFDLNFDKKSSVGYKLATVGLFIDFMLIIDILLNFRTSYKDNNIKSYIRNEKQITLHYLFSKGFILDVITSLPLELILYKIIPNKSKIFDTITVIEFIRSIKILRIIKAIKRFNTQTEHFDGWRRKCLDMTFVVYIMVFTAHLVACGWWWVGEYSIEIHKVHPQHYLADNTTIITYNKKNDTIISINGTLIERIWWGQNLIDLNEDDFRRKYIISFYWAVVTLLTTGYGDIIPSTTQEMFYVTIVVFLGTVLFGWIVGRVTELLLGKSLRDELINERIESAKIFCESIGLDKYQTRNVIDYVSYYSNNNYLGNVNDILISLPPDIRLSVLRQEKLTVDRESTNKYNISEHFENSYRNRSILNFDTQKSKDTFKKIKNYFSAKFGRNNNDLSDSLRASEIVSNDTPNTQRSINALKSSKIDHIPYVLLTKILFGDNNQIQDDEEFFNILSLKIKKMTIKEGELFTRSDQIETTLFITLNSCVVRYSYNPIINFSNDDWKRYELPAYTILGNLHSKYDVDISIQCYQDNGCLVYVLEKEDISSQLKLLDYRLENHEMENVYKKLIETNYHGLVIPYNQILKKKLLKSKVLCKKLRKNGFTAKTIDRRKPFPEDVSSTRRTLHEELMKKSEEKVSDSDNEQNIITKNKKKEQKKEEIIDFNDRELLLYISKSLVQIKKKIGLDEIDDINHFIHSTNSNSSNNENELSLNNNSNNEMLELSPNIESENDRTEVLLKNTSNETINTDLNKE